MKFSPGSPEYLVQSILRISKTSGKATYAESHSAGAIVFTKGALSLATRQDVFAMKAVGQECVATNGLQHNHFPKCFVHFNRAKFKKNSNTEIS